MFDTFAININGPRAWDLDVAVDVTFLDVDTNYRLTLRNSVLVYRKVAGTSQRPTPPSNLQTSCGC
jgi:alkyl sulfatase BDS1-like metallo-beta-lactamase superfamily hydrolase